MAGFRILLLIALALLSLKAPVAGATAFTDVYFFGASGEDTGVFGPAAADALLGLGLVPSYGYDPDRWTNAGGMVWSERFAAALGHGAVSSADGGTNYARGGARTDELAGQIAQFSADHSGVADSGALYVLAGGGNDMLQGYSTSDAVSGMLSLIDQLSTLGATNFLILNVPDFGPLAPGTGPLAPYAPIPSNASAWAAGYAAELAAALSTLSDLTIYQLDVRGLLDPIFADPMGHGFSAGLALCVNDPDCVAGVGVDEYLMFDHLHPTSAGHELIARDARTAVLGECADGLDNDADGRIDFPFDSGCRSASDPTEFTTPPGGGCGIGPELVLVVPLLAAIRRRYSAPGAAPRSYCAGWSSPTCSRSAARCVCNSAARGSAASHVES